LTDQSPGGGLADEELAPFFTDADVSSNDAQKRHLGQLRSQLLLLGVAAISGAFTWRWLGFDWAGGLGAIAFGAAFLVRLYAEQQRDERKWYESRAAAESAKTLCWRYAVGGNPFPEGMPDGEARKLLSRRFSEVGSELTYIEIASTTSAGGEVTQAMADLRRAARTDRIAVYDRDRIQSQQRWYADKSKWNEERARRWIKVVLLLEGLGLLGAVLKATESTSVDFLGICSALAAAGGAWLQARQHRTLAAAYNVTARELRRIDTLVDPSMTAEEWADFVDQAEEAISREHTMWVASRTGRRPLT
jgi:protein-S-isoprenylcysteine O-methyltransferase Ste14